MMQSLDTILGGTRREEIPENTIIFLEKLLKCENLINLRAISLGKKNGNSTLRLTGKFHYLENNVTELRAYLKQNDIHPQSLEIYPPDRAKLPYIESGIVLTLKLVRLYDTTITSQPS